MIGELSLDLPVYTASRVEPVPRVESAPRMEPAPRAQFRTPRQFRKLEEGKLVVHVDNGLKWLAVALSKGVTNVGVEVHYLQCLPGDGKQYRKIWQSNNPQHVAGRPGANNPQYRFTLSIGQPTQGDSNPWTPYTGTIQTLSHIKLYGLTLAEDGSLEAESYKAFDQLAGDIGAVSTTALRL